ncbi:unnamed protein product [Brassica oleracea]
MFENFVEDYVSRSTMLPLGKSRPLWDIHILNVKTSDAEAVCVIRSHHSLGDGTSLMSLLVACTQKTSDKNTASTTSVIKRPKMIFILKEYSKVCNLILIWNTFVDLLLALSIALFLKDTKTNLKGDMGVQNNPKKFCHRIVSLDGYKTHKRVFEGDCFTINDVLLGVTQAALSLYLKNFPGRIRLTACVLVNLAIGIQPLADMMAKDSKCRWGNYFSSVYFPLSTSSETDPLVYLTKAKSNMDRRKNSLLAPLIYSSAKFILNNFGANVYELN